MSLEDYLRRPLAQPVPLETLSSAEVMREDVMLGLRLSEGVTAAMVERAGLTGTLAALSERGLVSATEDAEGTERWHTTQRGWLLGNQVFGAVWAGE
jgi:oxygen-independent coproporphyrinogen-3 oxidase